MSSKTLGSILIVAGTAIGAGMLATPIITAAGGFTYAALLMIVLWAFMCISALLTAEAALAFPAGYNGFNTMARATLGRSGQAISWLAFLGLLYALNAAYISGGGSILSTTLETFFNIALPQWLGCLIFTCVFGSFIYWGAHSVDMINRVLISVKGVIFIISMTLVTPYIDLQNLFGPSSGFIYLLAGVPILITAFGFHVVIPSLVTYNQNQVSSVVRAIIIGSFIPLVVYLVWLAAVLGIIPLMGDMSFTQIIHDAITLEKDNVGLLLVTLNDVAQNTWISAAINFFSHLAITTSFLGVGLALFDFLIDVRKNRGTSARIQTILLTFIPPLIFALYFPQGFIMALGFAGIFVAITCIILPAVFVWKVRTSTELNSPLRIPGGTPLLMLIILFGASIIVLEILDKLGQLPTLASTLFG
jgi:tyrosine-specific transport protein